MTTIGISLPEHRISLPLQTVGDSPVTLDPNDADLQRYRQRALEIFDQGGRFDNNDLQSIVALFVLGNVSGRSR